MEKSLKIYTFVDGVKDTPFPDLANQVEAFDFTYSTSRMNVIPQLSASVMFKRCLDSEWNGEQYILFNGERYFIKQTPSSSKDNTDARWKHDITFVSERNILSGIYFYDVVTSNVGSDKYVSNSSNVLFFGDIHEFASRLNYSLQYSGVDYSVVIDDGISSEAMQVAFEDKFISEAIQEIYNIFDLPYYFVGKVCHIGYTSNAITTVLKYGDKDALLSIQKTNANYKIVNSCTGIGSTDNIPFYYPNPSNDRAAIETAGGKWITPSTNLMPPIYRTSLGAERFYPAKNNTYTDPETGLKYIFENTYTTKNPHQHKVLFESIKPSIKGMMNGQPTPKPMDKFLQFAYDTNDNDELDEENNFKHPYFFAKLPIYNGTFGFNLFDQAIVGQDMSMSMTSGNCGACNFVIGVDADSQKNVVQLNEDGTLKRDEDGNVITSGSPQLIQNDTTKYEVWIALKKDDSTFGILMPNAGGNYKPSVSDTFVILGIDMPQTYISAAEDRLYKEIIKYMFLNNAEKFTFAINFSRIYLAENPLVYNQLNENARIRIEYNGKEENLYISDYTYKVSKTEALPDITVTLSDTLTVRKGTLQTSIDSVKQEIMSSVGSSDFYKQGLKYFVRKDVPDYAVKITARDAFDVGSYSPNTGGGTFRRNADGTTFMEVDKLLVRIKAYFEQLEVVSTRYSGGNNIYSAAAMTCIKVEDKGANYRCYFLSEQDGTEVKNRFVVGDQVRCQEFDLIKKNGTAVTNRSYWRLVTGIGSDYIDISKTDAMAGSDIPLAGDDIIQFGNRTEKDRQNLIIQYTVGVNAPLYSMLQGVNSYSLEGKDILQQGFDASTGKAFQRIYGESYIGARDLSQFMKYTPEGGLEIKGKITSVGGDGITGSLDKIEEEITAIKTESDLFAESVTKNFEDIQDQIDGAIETWFEDPAPTLTNKPAIDWNTVALKNQHLGDLYYSGEGKAYRFQMNGSAYEWKMLSDSDITLALANAKKAQDTADGKRRVYIRQPLNAEVYDVGDLWVNANFGTTYSNDLLRCKVAKVTGAAFDISHWEKASRYTDDTKALEAQAAADAAKSRLDAWAADGTISPTEKQSLKEEIARIDADKNQITADYTRYGLGTATAYNTAHTNYRAALVTLSAATPENIAIPSDFATKQTAYYTQRTAALGAINTASKALSSSAQTAADKAIADAKAAQTAANTANAAVTDIKNFTDVAFADGVIDRGEAAAIEKYKNTVNESQKSIEGGYTKLYANGYLVGTAKTGLKTAYDAVGVSITALLAAINTAIADKKTTAAEKLTVDTAYATFSTKINLYYAAVEIANKSIQDVLKKYSDDALAAVADLSYLTAALNGNTSIQGGLVLTSLISLGTGTGASFIPKSGLNGIYNSAKVGGGIAFWVGGAMKDRADYTSATMPSDVAKGIDRFDGSGYRANGNMSWNAAGELTVSTQFFKVISSTGISKLEYSNVRDTLDFNANILFKTGITLKFEGDATDYIPYLKWLKSVFENDTTNNAVRVKKGIYSDSFVSAKGASTGGGGGGGIIQSVYPYSAISAVYVDTNLTDTFNAYTISKLASRIKIIEDSGVGGSTAWSDITGKPASFVPSAHVHPLSEISDLHANWDAILKLTPTAQITRWASWSEVTAKPSWIGATKPTYSYSEITGTPPAVDLSNYVTLNTTQNITGTKTLSGNTILHAANYNNYAPTKTGGGASGSWNILSSRSNVLELNYTALIDSKYGNYGGIIQGNGTDMGMPDDRWYNKIKILHGNAAGYYTELAQSFTGTNNLYYRKMENGTLGGWTTVVDSGNYTQILDGRYVNTTGDDMTGLLSVPVIRVNKINGAGIVINKLGDNYAGIGYSGLSNVVYYSKCDVNGNWVPLNDLHHELQGTDNVINVHSNTVYSWIYFRNNTKSYVASVGYYNNLSFIANEKTGYRIGVIDDGTPVFRMGNATSAPTHVLWHAGNDGSGSGLDADLLDGAHNYDFLRYGGLRSHGVIATEYTVGTFMTNFAGAGLYLDRGSWDYASNGFITTPYGKIHLAGTMSLFVGSGSAASKHSTYLAITPSTTGVVGGSCINEMLFYTSNGDNTSYPDAWTRVMTDRLIGYYNAGSATKLQTARSIWGQSFDGTGTVQGDLNNVDTIRATGEFQQIFGGSTWYLGAGAGGSNNYNLFHSSTGFMFSINQNGNVGIGTSSPSYKLDVNGDICARGFLYSKASGLEVMIGSQNTAYCHYSTAAATHWFNKPMEIQGTLKPYGGARDIGSEYAKWGNIFAQGAIIGDWHGLLGSPGGYSTNYLGSGNGDAASYASHNVILRSWYGIGIRGNDNVCRLVIDARSGSISSLGSINCSNRASVGGLISSDWLRTTGAVGWHSESYGGGIYMVDSNYVRVYGNKAFHVANTTWNAINTDGGYHSSWAGATGSGSGLSNLLNYQNSMFNANNRSTPTNGLTRMIGWCDTVGSQGYTSRYCISSYRTSAAWGSMMLSVGNNDAGSSGYYLQLNGNGQMYWTGGIAAAAYITAKSASSDIRLKKDITPYSALPFINSQRSVMYHWNDEAKANSEVFDNNYWNFGLIAQELQQVAPHFVKDVFKDYLTIEYERLIPIMWRGIQELDVHLTKHDREILELRRENNELKNQVAGLERRLTVNGKENMG